MYCFILFYFFKFYSILKLYIIVLVLPNIKMNLLHFKNKEIYFMVKIRKAEA